MTFRKKGFLIVLILSTGILSCSRKDDYKKIREEVIGLHDKVMAKNDELINQEMKIDTLLRNMDSLVKTHTGLDTVAEKKRLTELLKVLQGAENKMNDWMHGFEPDTEGKSPQESAAYFQKEKMKISRIENLYNVNISRAAEYLSKYK